MDSLEASIRHPTWARARHLALPMLLCWLATPIAFNGVPIYGRSWVVASLLLAFSVVSLVIYVWAAVLNYRHVLSVLGRGRCLACGYELWPTIQAGRWDCPECGQKISSRMAERVYRLRSVSDTD
ncbi:hypothetical protein [Algisphaera agarilytica]|uniref:Putative RNA-binding Zn-ribbon protein involved in translation (DUF1610 family) n=1 Tax=Algisphaera agarilytica TaxID=1385975 RepID=A0A7X0H8L1_9BACT|nr:hypothetical protein [Algisphaera agarilytica]MBB6431284.1 putative RNA-binding Zn-ribbon protein involved in translation (DUF1610 family) [Algisphaera agarilytica]